MKVGVQADRQTDKKADEQAGGLTHRGRQAETGRDRQEGRQAGRWTDTQRQTG